MGIPERAAPDRRRVFLRPAVTGRPAARGDAHGLEGAAKRSDVVVYAFSSANAPKATFFRDLTVTTGGALSELGSMKELSARFLKVLEEFRQRYLVTCTLRDVPKAGWHRLDVRVKGKDAKVKARPGYLAGG